MRDKKLILVIDDSETSILLVRSIFEESELFSVDSVNSSKNAFQKVKESKPDLILLDIMMPEIDGFELLNKIKNDDSIKSIPVIVVSAIDSYQDLEKTKSLGALDYVRKPIGINKLFDRVKAHFHE